MTKPSQFLFIALLFCAAALHAHAEAPALAAPRDDAAVPAYTFAFPDGSATYFVLDKGAPSDPQAAPQTFVFVIAGSDCINMQPLLPHYFDGLGDKLPGRARIFLLQKRFAGQRDAASTNPLVRAGSELRCSDAFVKADYPAQWLADHFGFILAQLDAARSGGHAPRRIVVVGISEGGEVAPLLARQLPAVTHVAILANGGMDPLDAFKLQSEKSSLPNDPVELERACFSSLATGASQFGGRSCRYWSELSDLRHTDNLLSLRIPLFMAMGEADRSVPIESAWYIRDRIAANPALQRPMLRMHTVPDADHGFHIGKTSRLSSVWVTLEAWLQE